MKIKIRKSNDKGKLIYAEVEEEDLDYEIAKMQLRATSEEDDWHNTITDNVYKDCADAHYDNRNVSKWLIDEYNRRVSDFNKYGNAIFLSEGMTPEKVAHITLTNYRNIYGQNNKNTKKDIARNE